MVWQRGEREEGVWGCDNRERGRRVCGQCIKQGEGEEDVWGCVNRERGRRVCKREESSMYCN